MSIRNLTNKLPYPIVQGLKYIHGAIPLPIRYGKIFRNTYKFLQESQWWDRDKLEEHQFRQLEKLLHHAYANVPYYKRIFDERDLKPKDIKSIDDLRKLPYLTKDIIRENFSDLMTKNYPKSKLVYATTGGTTGIQLGFYLERGVTNSKEWAFICRLQNWAGLRFGDKKVILRGNVINRIKNGKRQLWEYKPNDNALILSSYDMTDENMIKYIEKINKFKPVAFLGYPSSLYTLATFMKDRSLRINNPKCIITSSEILYPHQREIIEKHLGVKIFDYYGNAERNVLVMQCEKGSYHIISEYGVMELIDEIQNSVQKDGEIGEIIVTGFNNFAMPFIRYKTGDLAIYSKDKCTCGRIYSRIRKIEGRLQELIVSKRGNYISMTAINMHSDIFDNVKQFQFYQDIPGKVTFNIVKKDTYTIKDTAKIYNELMRKLGDNMELEIAFINNIPKTPRGKHRFLIQKLEIKYGE